MELKIKQLREDAQFSQEEMAQRMGISQSAYARFELSKTKIDLDRLESFAKKIGMSLIDVITYPNSINYAPNETHKNNIDDKEKQKIIDAYDNICKTISEDGNDFEHKITYLSAGAITLIFAYMNTNQCYHLLIFIGIFCLILTLILNIYSYLYGNYLRRKDAEILRNYKPYNPPPAPSKLILKTNKKVNRINWTCLGLFSAGLILVAISFLNQ